MPYFGCGLRNQSGRTPSSATRLSTPLEPTIAVLTAPERIRKPTTTTSAFRASLAQCGPDDVHRQAADQVALYLAIRTSSGMIITAKKLISDGQQQAVEEDDERRLLEVLQLGALDLAVDLRQRLLAAHRQDRVAERDEDAEHPDQAQPVDRGRAASVVADRRPADEAERVDLLPDHLVDLRLALAGRPSCDRSGASGGSVPGLGVDGQGHQAPDDHDDAP